MVRIGKPNSLARAAAPLPAVTGPTRLTTLHRKANWVLAHQLCGEGCLRQIGGHRCHALYLNLHCCVVYSGGLQMYQLLLYIIYSPLVFILDTKLNSVSTQKPVNFFTQFLKKFPPVTKIIYQWLSTATWFRGRGVIKECWFWWRPWSLTLTDDNVTNVPNTSRSNRQFVLISSKGTTVHNLTTIHWRKWTCESYRIVKTLKKTLTLKNKTHRVT